jgi:hypothetical protein
MRWRMSNRFDPAAARLADRHYSRQTPGSPQFVPPGRCLVLVAGAPVRALWVTSWQATQYTDHAWAGSWVCSLFRNEGAGLSSSLIVEAVAVTRWWRTQAASWRHDAEPEQMITFIKPDEIQSQNPGYCYKRAGFKTIGRSKTRGYPALGLPRAAWPAPLRPAGTGGQISLIPSAA